MIWDSLLTKDAGTLTAISEAVRIFNSATFEWESTHFHGMRVFDDGLFFYEFLADHTLLVLEDNAYECVAVYLSL